MFSQSRLWAVSILLHFTFPNTSSVNGTEIYDETVHRNKRQLLYPNSTLLQFNAGIGGPSPDKNINFNFAFQANFQLPWNRTQIPTDILDVNSGYEGDSRKKRETKYESDGRLHHFYQYVESVLNEFGYNGKACVLRTFCQLGAEPLHSDDSEDLLYELASFVLNPKNDAKDNQSLIQESQPYIEAYQSGQKAQDCINLFDQCSLSLIDIFTKLHDVS